MDMNEVPCREATSKLFLGPKYVEKMYNLIDVFRYYTCCSFAVIGFKADVSCIIIILIISSDSVFDPVYVS
jgi:hypothetical protein